MFQVTQSKANKDMSPGQTLKSAQDYYLQMYGDFQSRLELPTIYPCPDNPELNILDFADKGHSLKTYGAEQLIATTKQKTLAYASVRVGLAPEAVAKLAEMYDKRAVFFAAASKQVTEHQAVVLAYKGCELRFAKIPAMPVLNKWIHDWAEEYGAVALPFGLADLPLVNAGLVKLCDNLAKVHGEPSEFYCAVSTGTLIRSLAIGWPNSTAKGVAVARNMKDGEIGHGDVVTYHKGFYKDSDVQPPFKSTPNYDSKAYDRFLKEGKPGAIFINVGSDDMIRESLKRVPGWQDIDGKREWKDLSDFQRP